jgi:cardiolipin synthase
MAYFLPTWRIRRALIRVARGGGTVELVLAGKSDVTLAQLAGRSLYRRFLRTGIKIFEYEPQILHMKLIVIDDVVYIGSANLDQRSLKINYELMVRFESSGMAAEASDLFQRTKAHSREVTPDEWKSRSLWQRIKQRWAYFLLVRMDPRIASLRS